MSRPKQKKCDWPGCRQLRAVDQAVKDRREYLRYCGDHARKVTLEIRHRHFAKYGPEGRYPGDKAVAYSRYEQ